MKRITILLAEAIIFVCLLGWVHSYHRDKEKILVQNLEAATDSLRVTTLKNGDLLFQKEAWVLEKENLEKVLDINKKEINDLQRKLGSTIKQLSEIQAEVRTDTIATENIVYRDSTYHFNYQNEYLRLGGSYNPQHIQFSTIQLPVTLYTGLTADHQIFVESSNPYLIINSLEGAILDKKVFRNKPRICHGLQIGFGLQYGIINKNVDAGPYIGYGLEINF